MAALRPVLGRERVARFYATLAARAAALRFPRPGVELRWLNGAPAAVLRFSGLPKPYAPLVVLQCRLDAEGRVAEVWTVSASAKLTAVLGGAARGRAIPRP